MTIRKELEKIGPQAVRDGMAAFEHRGDLQYIKADRTCPDYSGMPCCFLSHASDAGSDAATTLFYGHSALEDNFENWRHRSGYSVGREGLRQECIAYLAEHGDAIENRPVQHLESVSR